MLTYEDGVLTVLGEEIGLGDIKDMKGINEFGKTGAIRIVTADKTYEIYGVKDYSYVIRSIDELIIQYKRQ